MKTQDELGALIPDLIEQIKRVLVAPLTLNKRSDLEGRLASLKKHLLSLFCWFQMSNSFNLRDYLLSCCDTKATLPLVIFFFSLTPNHVFFSVIEREGEIW